jgi:phytoene dehydrogenase-like protein
VTDRVSFIHVPNLYRSIFPDLDVTLPSGREAFEAKLCELFPHEARSIRRFVKRVFDLRSDFIAVSKQRGAGNPLTMPLRLPHFFRYLPVTWGHVLDRDVKDQQARGLLSQYWGYVGMPPSEISFFYFATALAAYVTRGAAFPQGRSQALSSGFLATFEELGGEARMNCDVREITTTNSRVTGVVTEEGEEITADWVISNADPITTCRDMIGAGQVDPGFFSKLQSSEIGPATVNVYMGVTRSPEELGLTEHEIFINSDYDFDRHYAAMRTIGPPPAIAVTCYNAVYPDISPPGTSIVVLTALAYGEPWTDIAPEAYVETKNRVADAMIDMAEAIAPGLRAATEVVEVSTPITNMRYASTLGGSIYGFNQPPRDNIVWRMGHRGPLDRLYFVGAWTRPGGGFEPSIMSGQMAGSAVLGKIKRMTAET